MKPPAGMALAPSRIAGPCILTAALAWLAGCLGSGEAEDEPQSSTTATLLATSFANEVSLCPETDDWGAWGQTDLSTWDDDVRPIIEWIMGQTGISCSTYSGHDPSIGRAADWRPHSREEGTGLANWFLANTTSTGAPLGIDYTIWQAQIGFSTGTRDMEDRGSFTQNHCDHVHVSFEDLIEFAPGDVTPWQAALPIDAGTVDAGTTDAAPVVRPDAELPADAGTSPVTATDAAPTPMQPGADWLVGGCAIADASDRDRARREPWPLIFLALLLPRWPRRSPLAGRVVAHGPHRDHLPPEDRPLGH